MASLVSQAFVMRPAKTPLTAGEAFGFAAAADLIVLFGVTRFPKRYKTKNEIRGCMYR